MSEPDAVDGARLQQLPRPLAPARAARLESERDEVLGADHPDRYAIVIVESCFTYGFGHKGIVRGRI
jgi:hypothetical protein